MKKVFAVLYFVTFFFLTMTVSSCSWWNSKGKAETVAVLDCTANDLKSQAVALLAQILAGDLSAVMTVGSDVLTCALQVANAAPAALSSEAPTKHSNFKAAAKLLKIEMNRRHKVKVSK